MVELAHRHLGGEGNPPLIILHGLLGSSRNWMTAGRDLAQRYSVWALDARNHGDSPWAGEQTYADMAEDVKAWLDRHELRSTVLCGHSMGGKTAMVIACRYPQLVERLVIVDIAPKAYADRWATEFAAMRGLDLGKISSRAEADRLLGEHITDWAFRQFLLTNLARGEDGSFRWIPNLDVIEQALPEIFSQPLGPEESYPGRTRFIRGAFSRFLTARDAFDINDHFPAAQLVTVPEAGHNVHFDNREGFVEAFFLP